MTLHIPFDNFPAIVEKLGETRNVFLTSHDPGCRVTAAHPANGSIIRTSTDRTVDDAQKWLEEKGMIVHEGQWECDTPWPDEETPIPEAYITAVAYLTDRRQPGLWVDASPSPLSNAQVLRNAYDEFVSNGEIAEVTFEEFVRVAEPTVVILTPDEVDRFVLSKDNC